MSVVLWVVGEPGVGKTTLVRELIRMAGPRTGRHAKPKWDEYGGVLALAGHYDGGKFDGADTMPISDIKPALDFWGHSFKAMPLTIFDGDKFSNIGARDFIRGVAPEAELRCVLLTDDPKRTAARRAARGSAQNETWVKGRITKSARFAAIFDACLNRHLATVDELDMPDLAAEVADFCGGFPPK